MADNKNIAVQCFLAGNAALKKENWDYAIKMYGTAVQFDPANLAYRQTLRASEQKKYEGNRTGASMSKVHLVALKPKLSRARKHKDWKGLSEAAEEGLLINPWDVQLNIDLGDACRELQYHEVAIFAYEEALKVDSDNLYVNEALSEVLADRGEYDRAVACCKRILKADPNNGAARSKISGLEARRVMDRGGYDQAENIRGVMADSEVKKRLNLGQEADAPGMSLELDLQHAIRKDPQNRENHLKLADVYKRDKRYDEAIKHLNQALQLSNNDPSIREVKEDIELDQLRGNLERAKDKASTGDDPHAQQRAGEIARELLLREIEVLTKRVERYPNDMKIKYQLAERLMRQQQWTLAIPLLQQARGDNRIKGPALIALGKCFMYDRKTPIARKMLEMAIPEVDFDQFPEEFKDLHYVLARLCEQLQDNESALRHFQEVLTVDYNYRDTLARLEKLHGSEQGPQIEI